MPLTVSKALTENYSKYYEHNASLSEWRRLGAIDKCANIIQLCSGFDRKEVLEIGCGDGSILQRLSSTGFSSRYTGLEISASGVRAVREKNIPGTSVELFDGYELRFADKQFNLAILSHVIEHAEYPRRLIQEAARVASRVFVEVPARGQLATLSRFCFRPCGAHQFLQDKDDPVSGPELRDGYFGIARFAWLSLHLCLQKRETPGYFSLSDQGGIA